MPADKIKAKDLSYDSSLPPFLQRLHAQNAGRGDTDRHERPIARPRRVKDPDEDDGPTIVDETGETISKDDAQRLTNGTVSSQFDHSTVTGAGGQKGSGTLQDERPDLLRPESKVTNGAATKKRKVAKVVGKDDDDSDGKDSLEKNRTQSLSPNVVKKAKKKAKAIKLAFENDDET